MYRADGYISEQSRLERCFPRVCVGTGRPAKNAISLGMCPPGSDTTGRTAHLRNSREARAPGGWTHRRNRTDSKNPWRASPGHRTNRAAHLDSSQSSDASPGRLGGASQSDRWDPKTLPLLPPKNADCTCAAGDSRPHTYQYLSVFTENVSPGFLL
jgi:hypothetical protein